MASLRRKDGSPYWFACFTLPNGKQTQRSTKEINQRKALEIALEYERATRVARTAHQARKVIDAVYEVIRGEKLSEVRPVLSCVNGLPTARMRQLHRLMFGTGTR